MGKGRVFLSAHCFPVEFGDVRDCKNNDSVCAGDVLSLEPTIECSCEG